MAPSVTHVVERRPDPIPACPGIGLKAAHFQEVLATRPAVGWFEVHPENYFVDGGPMHRGLTQVRERYPLSFHSVGMSLGSADGSDPDHMRQLKALCGRYEPGLVSDHLSWSRWQHMALNDLLPLPYTQATLDLVLENVDRAQTLLGRRIALENPSSYLGFSGNEFEETDFLVELARRSGAGILLDVNNLYVSAMNLGRNAAASLARIPAELVTEIHLAGHKVEHTEAGVILIDDHGSTVSKEVWRLYGMALELYGRKPTLIEWDTNVPDFGTLLHEARQARAFLRARDKRSQSHACDPA